MIRNFVSRCSLQNSILGRYPLKSVIGLIGIQEDRNSSFQTGPQKAPALIRKHFLEPAVNSWSELGIDVFDSIVDFGDIQPTKSSHSDIFAAVNPSIQEMQEIHGLVPLTLGGDHSITFSTCKAVRRFINSPLVIVHFDAHPDIYEDFEGNPDSHASPFARILEVPGLCQQLISIGIRTLNGEQSPQIRKYGVHLIEAKDFPSKGSDISGVLKKFVLDEDTPVYITFDMDVLDPGFAPGVSHREPGGLSVRQAIDAIHCVPGRIVGADIVEYNPDRDIDYLTASVAAKIMKELAAKIILSNKI